MAAVTAQLLSLLYNQSLLYLLPRGAARAAHFLAFLALRALPPLIAPAIFFPANLSHIEKQKENTEKPQKSFTHTEIFPIKQLFGPWFSFHTESVKGFFVVFHFWV